jgi:hypothetical protein
VTQHFCQHNRKILGDIPQVLNIVIKHKLKLFVKPILVEKARIFEYFSKNNFSTVWAKNTMLLPLEEILEFTRLGMNVKNK